MEEKNSKFLCGHRKGHTPCLTPIWSLYTLLFVITNAHNLLGPFIQLYSGNFIQSLYTCTAFCHYTCIHFEWLSLLYILTLATHTHGAHTVLGSVVLLYIYIYLSPVSVHSGTAYTTALYNCTLASASLASVLSTNHRRALIYLLHSDWSIRHRPTHPLNCSMLTQPFCPAERAV